MSKLFRGETCGRSETIRELLKDLNNEENYISENELEREDCVKIQNYEFIGTDKDENDEQLFESTDEGKQYLKNKPRKMKIRI
ncbi:hypothetical protein NPIL_669431 [Nephila pilipes]|uniref:Uncharacterized protein n=1 Tax=Nephila pilipes TaxID=299642 RepID=A0A8X6MU51_NEPPI|nr:hypothetical protein NPIL_669431 [Nephila pilipes]